VLRHVDTRRAQLEDETSRRDNKSRLDCQSLFGLGEYDGERGPPGRRPRCQKAAHLVAPTAAA
jgi:hypothetical protein